MFSHVLFDIPPPLFFFKQIDTVYKVQMASKTTALKLLALSNRGII